MLASPAELGIGLSLAIVKSYTLQKQTDLQHLSALKLFCMQGIQKKLDWSLISGYPNFFPPWKLRYVSFNTKSFFVQFLGTEI